MILNTRHFGEITINDETIIHFENGILGFFELKRFVIIQSEDCEDLKSENNAFCWLQCLDDSDITFVLMNALNAIKDYNPTIEQKDVSDLGEFDENGFLIYNIVKIPENIKEMTVNLKAPVVINSKTLKGKQVVLESDEYSIRHAVFGGKEEGGSTQSACSNS